MLLASQAEIGEEERRREAEKKRRERERRKIGGASTSWYTFRRRGGVLNEIERGGKKRWNCRFRDRTVAPGSGGGANQIREEKEATRCSLLAIFSRGLSTSRSLIVRSLLRSLVLTRTNKEERSGEIQISGVAVIKRNPRYECAGRPCSFRG